MPMKALIYTFSLLISASVLGSCSQNQFAQQEYDDMYYTAEDRQQAVAEEQAREQARLEAQRQRELERQRERELAAAERQRSAYDKSDVQSGREINPDASTGYNDYYQEEYYEEEGEYYDTDRQSYASGNRQPVINNYYSGGAYNAWRYDPWRYDPYWNSYASPWGWNSGFSINIGWNSWNSWDPFWDPFWHGSAYYYDAYRPAWAWNGWGYHNSYARGYRDGFYDAHWRRNYWGAYYPGTVVVYQGDNNAANSRRNVTYGPRSTRSMAVADLGVGERASSRQQINDARRQRSFDPNSRGLSPEGERSIRPNRGERTYPGERGRRAEERANPSSRPRAPRNEPIYDHDRTRPSREPSERSRPNRPAPSERPSRPAPSTRPARPTPDNGSGRPSSPSRGNDGGSRPSRDNGGSAPSRSRGGNEALQGTYDSNWNQAPAEQERTQERPVYQPRERAMDRSYQPAERSDVPASRERREEPAYERNTFSRPEPRERSIEERPVFSRPASNSRNESRESISRPQHSAPSYSRPAPQERSAPARISSPAPSRPAPSAPARNNESSAEKSRPSRSRGGN